MGTPPRLGQESLTGTVTDSPEGEPRRRTTPEWTRYAGLFLLMAIGGTLWAISSPVMSVPDEPAHTVKAAAVWRGEWQGRLVELPPLKGESTKQHTYAVDVPRSFAELREQPACYAFFPEYAANCSPDLSTSDKVVETTTLAGAYPPLYYVAVGWPSRFLDAGPATYAMRIVSALLGAAFMLLGGWALRRFLSWPLVLLVLAIAGTPEVYYLSGAVNPNGLEVTAAFAMWASALALVTTWRKDEAVDRRLVAALLVSTAVATNVRSLSPLFAAVILATVALFAGWRRIRELGRDRGALVLAGASAAIIGVSAIWIVASGHLSTITGGHPVVPDDNVVLTLGSLADDWFAQMIAFFGWSDVGPVLPAVWIWLAVIGLVVGVALLVGRGWRAGVLLATFVGVAIAPVVLQYPSARNGVIIWQGRYLLPLAVGVPVLAIAVLNESDLFAGLFARVSRRLCVSVVSLLAVAHIAAHMAAMRRYVVGIKARLNYFALPRWSPPIAPWILLFLTVGAWFAWVFVVWRADAERVDAGPRPEVAPE